MTRLTILCLVSVTWLGGLIAHAQDKPAATFFEQDVKDSNPLRAEQAKELDE